MDLAILVIAGLIAALIGAKPGAGKHHLLPFSLIVLYMVHKQWHTLRPARFGKVVQTGLVALIALTVASSIGIQLSILDYMQRTLQQQLPAAQEIADILRADATISMEIGYAAPGEYPTTFVRPLLVFAGQQYRMDAAALMDMQYYGVDLQKLWSGNFARCQPKRWLIPSTKNEIFNMTNYYGGTPADFSGQLSMPLNHPLFSDAFRNDFRNHYIKIKSGRIFDIYECAHQQSSPQHISP